MIKRITKICIVIVLIVSLIFQTGIYEASAAPNKYYAANNKYKPNFKKISKEKETTQKKKQDKTTEYTTESDSSLVENTTVSKEEITTNQKITEEVVEEETTINQKTTEEVVEESAGETTVEQEVIEEETTTKKQETTKEETTTVKQETTKEEATTVKQETTKEETTTAKQETTKEETTVKQEITKEETTTVKQETTKEEITTVKQETTKEEITTEKETTTEKVTVEQETVVKQEISANDIRFQQVAAEEAQWLWAQQLSNGAFAVHNEKNGTVDINPYFGEIVAIALINYDSSDEAKAKIENYFDWHISHINTASEDYNGLAGTIYDYKVKVKNGVVVSETSKGVYDSTDSYSALFVKALADYAKVYGDGTYLNENAAKIKDIVNVMFATMSPNGYTYAKPDYKIIYLMDNTEVYAGLTAAQYIYTNVIKDSAMLEKVTKAVNFYEENFNNHWWKGDHYAAVLNPDYSEYTGYAFSWDMFYPCATAQMFPIMYGLAGADSQYAKTLYSGLCAAWDWQDMDYVSEGVDVFCWGSFAYLGGLVGDEVRLNGYLDKYNEIVEGGRLYPLYSAESAMVLMGCIEMLK